MSVQALHRAVWLRPLQKILNYQCIFFRRNLGCISLGKKLPSAVSSNTLHTWPQQVLYMPVSTPALHIRNISMSQPVLKDDKTDHYMKEAEGKMAEYEKKLHGLTPIQRNITCLKDSLDSFMHLGMHHDIVVGINLALGENYLYAKNYGKCIQHIERYFTRMADPDHRPIKWDEFEPKDDQEGIKEMTKALNILLDAYRYNDQLNDAIAVGQRVISLESRHNEVTAQYIQAGLKVVELYCQIKKEGQAIELMNKIRKNVENLPRNDPDVTTTLHIYTAQVISNSLGNHKAALKMLQNELEVTNKALVENQPNEAVVKAMKNSKFFLLRDLAIYHCKLENFDKTESCLRDAFKVACELFPDNPDHLYAASICHSLGRTYDSFNRSSLYAEGYYNRAMGAYESPENKQEIMQEGPVHDAYITLLEDFSKFYRRHSRVLEANLLDKKLKEAKILAVKATQQNNRDKNNATIVIGKKK